ncbi:flagellar hook assembly protein FlgD [Tenuibacillus multivorans]|uniref:Flagellar basal-body rod modification protein FlgD n=1 Tax=Tenuibacillus multivorans TaxID=237069 RepID=A0A1G9XZL2_9BACI|nr:flagellar hook assembly protein FlgD [Tenuibacillus multivorans]GEL75874.1 hypothetical protein TMU01_01090 [Tenuibacillus multivorans]SDN01896.1 flagellar basal-body rod modification protein FlgD [Tenuibacillus multivorans]
MKVEDSSLYLSNQNQVREGGSSLNKDAFLKILMTQLQNQDPLSPMDNKAFVNQMASFSQLEQLTNLSSNFEKMFQQQNNTNFLQYSNLIGKEVSYVLENEEGEIEESQSQVVSVKREGQNIFLSMENGDLVNALNAYQVTEASEGATEESSTTEETEVGTDEQQN